MMNSSPLLDMVKQFVTSSHLDGIKQLQRVKSNERVEQLLSSPNSFDNVHFMNALFDINTELMSALVLHKNTCDIILTMIEESDKKEATI